MRCLFLSVLVPLVLLVQVPCARAQLPDPVYSDGFEGVGALTANWQAALDLHNAVRAGVTPAAVPALVALQWNAGVAAAAQAHADRCLWTHSGTSGLGENLYARSGWSDAEHAAATSWAGESVHYDYATNRCASGRQCGHYTQMVWRSTSELGCGIRRCSSGSPWGADDWTLVVCNYRPPGNYVGQRPY